MRRHIPLHLLLLLILIAAGCGGGKTSSSGGSASASSADPPGTAAMPATSPLDDGPRAFEVPVDHERAEEGAKLFQSKGCTACHAIGRKLTCPDLAGVTKRRTAKWIQNQILHPEVMTKQDPIAHALFAQFSLQMPNQGLTPDQALAVIDYFNQMEHKSAPQAESHEGKEEHK